MFLHSGKIPNVRKKLVANDISSKVFNYMDGGGESVSDGRLVKNINTVSKLTILTDYVFEC